MEKTKPDKTPIYLSAILPGLGQCIQKRWITAVVIIAAFLACLVLLTLVTLQHLSSDLDVAFVAAKGAENQEPCPSPVTAIISCLVLALLVYLISLCDVVLAYIRTYRLWAQKKLMEKLTKTSQLLIITSLIIFSIPASAQDLTENIDPIMLDKEPFDAKFVANEIHRAIRDDNITEIDKLIQEHGPCAVQVCLQGGATPLHLSAALGRDIITTTLLANDASVSAKTSSGFTPLHWAASRDSIKSAKLLIAVGADINARTELGITPAHWAAEKNATNVLKLLILSNADIYAKTDQKMAPIHWAIRKNSADAAAMLAFKQTSDEERDGKLTMNTITNTIQTEDDIQTSAETTQPTPDPVPQQEITPTIALNSQETPTSNTTTPLLTKQSLVIHIGHGQELKFIRIERMKLWVGKYEITNGQYKRFKHKHKSMFRENFSLEEENQPVVYVTWNDANDYCKWLNKNFSGILPYNSKFRLPTSEEWTTFASCGETRKYPWGNDWPPHYGNFSDITARKNLNDWKGIRKYDDGYTVTCPVDKSGANEWGIFGIAGNVWGWNENWHDDLKKYKVRRGGSWDFDPKESLEVKHSGFDRPNASYDTIGFRLVISSK